MDIRIVILQRRWALVGVYSRDGLYGRLDHAAVIRRWGTTRGIGQIAGDGPTGGTVLDPLPRGAEFFEPTVVATFACSPDKWVEVLNAPST